MDKTIINKIFFCKKCGSDLSFEKSGNESNNYDLVKCKKCGFKKKSNYGVFDFAKESDFNSDIEFVKNNYNDIWERFKKFNTDTTPYEKEKEIIKKFSNLIRNKIILEAGVGDGRDLELIISNKPRLIICIDAFEAIYLARKRYDSLKQKANIIFIKSDLIESPIKNQSIDLTWSMGVLSVVHNQIIFLEKLSSFTKKNIILGTLSDNFYGNIYYILKYLRFLFYFMKNKRILWILTLPLSIVLFLLFKIVFKYIFINNPFLKKINTGSFKRSITIINGLLQEPLLVPNLKKIKNKSLISIMKKFKYKSKFLGDEIFLKYFIFSKN